MNRSDVNGETTIQAMNDNGFPWSKPYDLLNDNIISLILEQEEQWNYGFPFSLTGKDENGDSIYLTKKNIYLLQIRMRNLTSLKEVICSLHVTRSSKLSCGFQWSTIHYPTKS